MRAVKENPIFFSVTGLLLLVSLVFSILFFMGSLQKTDLAQQFGIGQDGLIRAISKKPYPTKDNLEKSDQNVSKLQVRKTEHEENLLGKGKLQLTPEDVPDYEFTVKRRIREYALAKRAQAKKNNVKLKKGANKETFGFSNYVDQTTTTNNNALAREIDKQRTILDHVLTQLLDSGITEFIAVRRENLENQLDPTLPIAADDVFQLDRKMSARVIGAIDTYAFQFEFAGYTSGLRKFFNQISSFELPVVVRDVNATRVQQDTLVTNIPASSPVPFNRPGAAPFSPAPFTVKKTSNEQQIEQQPVVDKNLSRFRIILEFIELAQPVEEVDEGN
ncbi:MAG: Amuc_1100 family pilus-like protein [Opitutales bacterium]|nr:Amuc_1100 family pilus-like protein [Opitutales bacterium]